MKGQSHIEGDAGVEAQSLAHDMLQVSHILQIVISRRSVGADTLEDFATEFRHDGRVVGEFVEEPGEHGGGGVAAGEEDGDDLVADDFAVVGEAREGVQEGVARVGFRFLFQFRGREAQGVVDVGVYEGVELFDAGEEGAPGDEPVEWAGDGRLAMDMIEVLFTGRSHPARAMMFCTRWTSAKASANFTCGSPKLFTLLPRRKSVMASKVYLR